jgi:hypothetical protein
MPETPTPWIACDLDGTLAEYTTWKGDTNIGKPIMPMVQRVKSWLDVGYDVRIFTARAAHMTPEIRGAIERWCQEHIGQKLAITNVKDFQMIEIWDDRAIAVENNTGRILGGRSRL